MQQSAQQPEGVRPTEEPPADEHIDLEALIVAVERLLQRDLAVERERLGFSGRRFSRFEW